MSSGLLALCTGVYGLAAALGLYRMRSRLFRPGSMQFLLFLVALGLHTACLVIEGKSTGHCPVLGLPNVLVFVGWALAVAYVVAGPVYRFTVPGVLTAPLVAMLLGLAAVVPERVAEKGLAAAVEFHAAISLLAYGALGLACVTGLTYLIHEHLIKAKRLTAWLDNLPSLHELGRVNRDLLFYGLVLMTAGVASGFFVPGTAGRLKMMQFVLMWVLYAGVWGASVTGRLGARRTALLSSLLFGAMVLSFWTLSMPSGATPEGS